jgi:hypothetical protein
MGLRVEGLGFLQQAPEAEDRGWRGPEVVQQNGVTKIDPQQAHVVH